MGLSSFYFQKKGAAKEPFGVGWCEVVATQLQGRRNLSAYSISKSIVSLLPSPCRATALSAVRRLGTIDLEMELLLPRRNSKRHFVRFVAKF
jgi:hypothetical protein